MSIRQTRSNIWVDLELATGPYEKNKVLMVSDYFLYVFFLKTTHKNFKSELN